MYKSRGTCYRFLKPTCSIPVQYRCAEKSLARRGRKQAEPVKTVMAEERIDYARLGTCGGLL